MQRSIFSFAEQNFWWTVIAQRVHRLFFSRSCKGLGRAKFLVGADDCKKLFNVCIYLQKSFAFAGKQWLHNYLKAVYRRRAKEQSIHGQQNLMHRALGFIDKEYERLWFWNFMVFETKICGFWMDFEADFKPSILKQDKGVWFSGIEMPENAVRQSLSAFRFVILLRMIPNSYAVKAVFRRKSRLLRIHLSVAVWWLKIEWFWQRCKQKLTSSLRNRVTRQTKTKNGLQAICASLWAKPGG